MMDTPGTLHQQVEEFGQETAELLCATLPGLPDPSVRILRYEDRFVISPPNSKPLPLYVSGERLADMKVSIACQLDSVGHYLAVEESKFDLQAVLGRTPVLRIHYRRKEGARQPTCTSTGTVARCPTCCPGPGTAHRTTCPHCTSRSAAAASGHASRTSSSSSSANAGSTHAMDGGLLSRTAASAGGAARQPQLSGMSPMRL